MKFIVVFSIFMFNSVFAQWVHSNHPFENVVINCFASSGDTLFAGGNYGIYYSTDVGTNWTETRFTHTIVNSLIVHGDTLFAGTHLGVYRSTNRGEQWDFTDVDSSDISTLAHSDTILAAAGPNGIFVSEDHGAHWSMTTLQTRYVHDMIVNGATIIASTQNGLFRSTNKGMTWDTLPLGTMKITVNALAIMDTLLFAGTSGNGVMYSTDDGTHWFSSGMKSGEVYFITTDGSELYAYVMNNDGAEIWRSTDRGMQWTYASYGIPGMDIYSSVCALKIFHGHIFASWKEYSIRLPQGILFRSSDHGNHWKPVNAGMSRSGTFNIVKSDSLLFATAWNMGVFRSKDNGIHWSHAGLIDHFIGAVASFGEYIFAADQEEIGVWRSTNYGEDWITADSGLPVQYIHSLFPHFATDGSVKLFAGTNSAGVYVSTDTGATWSQTSMITKGVYTFASIGEHLFAGTGEQGVFHTTNNGITWSAVNNGLTDLGIGTLVVRDFTLFAGTQNGVFRSTDLGASWTGVNEGLSNKNVSCLTTSNSLIIAGTYSAGFFISSNNGSTWKSINDGMGNISGYSAAISGGTIVIGTDNGVWTRPINDVLNSVDEQYESMPLSFSLEQNYPNPFNPSTSIRFSLPSSANVKLSVYDLLGREITILVNEEQAAGWKEVEWNAGGVSSGIFFYKLQAGSFVGVKKLMVLK